LFSGAVLEHMAAVIVRVELRASRGHHRLHIGPDLREERNLPGLARGVAGVLRLVRPPVLRVDDFDGRGALEHDGVRRGADIEAFGLLVNRCGVQPWMGLPRVRWRRVAEQLRDR
jgi:hypothetical protein